MVQIIQPARGGYGGRQAEKFAEDYKDFASQIMQGHQQSQDKKLQQQNNSQANQMASQLLGMDVTGLDPKTRDQLIMEKFKQEGALNLQNSKAEQAAKDLQSKKDQENQEKLGPLEGALNSIDRMTKIRKKGNLGFGSHVKSLYGGDTAKDRGEYEQLGKSLISYATNIPIRNRIEFETLAERLYDSSVTDKEAEGILNSMKSIIQNSMSAYGGQSSTPSLKQSSVGQQNRPPLTQFVGK